MDANPVIWVFSIMDGLVKSLLKRHPGEPRIRSRAGAGVQNMLKELDSGFRRNDEFYGISTFYEIINYGLINKSRPFILNAYRRRV